MIVFSPRVKTTLVWLLFAILFALLVWGPPLLENLLAHRSSFWRVPLSKVVLFDTELYLQMLGGAIEGFPYGKNLSWIRGILHLLSEIFPSASVSEVWLVSRWLALGTFFALGPWCIRQWSQLSRPWSWLLFISLWAGVFLPLGMRPGIYSWYIPFCFLGMVAVYRLFYALREQRRLAAIGYTLAALVLTVIYPWFFIFTSLWAASLWAAWGIRSFPTRWYYYFIPLTALVCTSSATIAFFFEHPFLIGMFQRLARSGVGYTHLPFIANSVVVIFFWLIFLLAWGRLRSLADAQLLNIRYLQGGWTVLLLSWFFSPFTGIVFQNDHFRTPILALSWITMSILFSFSISSAAEPTPPRQVQGCDRYLSGLIRGLTLLAGLAILYFAAKWIRNPGDDLSPLHLSLWLTACASGWLTVLQTRNRQQDTPPVRRLLLFILCFSCASGLIGWGLILKRGSIVRSPGLVAMTDWIRTHVSPSTDLCSTLKTGNFLSAYTARRIHPMHAMRYTTELDEVALRRLDLILGAHDAIGAGTLPEFELYALVDRFIPCEQYPWAKKLLSAVGMEKERINDVMGCDERTILQHQARLRESAARHRLEPEAFSAACPVVVFPSSQRPFWHLPEGYREVFGTDEMKIWADKRLSF